MAFTELTSDLNVIQALDDEPNDVGGLSAAQLKGKFDEGANLIKEYLNRTLLPQLGGADGAPNLGVAPIPELPTVENIQDALTGIIAMLQDITQGAVADGSITEEKLANLAVTTGKLADEAVTEAKLAENAVSAGKIANLAVATAKLADLAVTAAKLADGAVTTAKLAAKAVSNDKVADLTIAAAKLATNSVETSKIKDGNVTAAKLAASSVETNKIKDGAVTMAKLASGAVSSLYTATIGTAWSGSAAPYSQTITVNGLLSTDNPVIDVETSGAYSTVQNRLDAWAEIYRMVASNNALTVYSNSRTTTPVPIKILCIRR